MSTHVLANSSLPSYAFCGRPLEANAFGRPLDYNDPREDANIHKNVENYHFNRDVESLVKGQTGELPLDISYILVQIPNHYRALFAMGKWERLNGYEPVVEGIEVYSADCFFRRALTFQPADPTLHMLYGMHLHYLGSKQDALKEYLVAKSLDPDHVELNYNLGLLYFDLQEFGAARDAAKVAYSQNYPLLGLKHKLQRAGQWVDEASDGITDE